MRMAAPGINVQEKMGTWLIGVFRVASVVGGVEGPQPAVGGCLSSSQSKTLNSQLADLFTFACSYDSNSFRAE
ncbi:unnamed protein product [Toxocara canis]|uniref:Secreted protein n=1 Tax=Toxocara canis TaxID=6265 RepID=A0A183TWV4_TOXCA|nr:unnamed protein product [Toxocara canis]